MVVSSLITLRPASMIDFMQAFFTELRSSMMSRKSKDSSNESEVGLAGISIGSEHVDKSSGVVTREFR